MFLIVLVSRNGLTTVKVKHALEFEAMKLLHHKFVGLVVRIRSASPWTVKIFLQSYTALAIEH
jgi:hypothetical protein